MSVVEARELLGREAEGLTDAEVAAIREDWYRVAALIVSRHAPRPVAAAKRRSA